MIISKNINNNFALATDDKGNSVIISGKGIGFGSCPRIVTDFSKINATFYQIDSKYISMITSLDDDVIDVSEKIIKKAENDLGYTFDSIVVMTLANHIQSLINKKNENVDVNLPVTGEVKELMPKEYDMGVYATSLIKKELAVELAEEAAASIALLILSAQ